MTTRAVSGFLVILFASQVALAGAGQQSTADTEAVMRRYAERLAPGSAVSVRTKDGERFTATLVDVTADAVLVKPRTRLPEPIRAIPFASLDMLEPKTDGMSVGRAVAIGAGAGAASFGALLLIIAAALAGD
jgi:hypothetical protein